MNVASKSSCTTCCRSSAWNSYVFTCRLWLVIEKFRCGVRPANTVNPRLLACSATCASVSSSLWNCETMADKQCYIVLPYIVSTCIELYCKVFFGAKRETATVLRSLIGNHARWKNEVPGLWLAPQWNRTYLKNFDLFQMVYICKRQSARIY